MYQFLHKQTKIYKLISKFQFAMRANIIYICIKSKSSIYVQQYQISNTIEYLWSDILAVERVSAILKRSMCVRVMDGVFQLGRRVRRAVLIPPFRIAGLLQLYLFTARDHNKLKFISVQCIQREFELNIRIYDHILP